MNLSVGIVGLPNVGKSTLFNALLKKQQALAANYPFATIEPNVGIVPVPDERLTKLAEITAQEIASPGLAMTDLKLPPIKPATVEFVDIAGLVKGASEGAGLGNKFLSHIREVQIIAHVIRAFSEDHIIREGSVDPRSDYETIETELMLADLQTMQVVQSRINRATEASQKSAIEKVFKALSDGKTARSVLLTDEEAAYIKTIFLLSNKKELIVLNVSEAQYSEENIQKLISEYATILGVPQDVITVVCAKIEEELAALSTDEQKEYLAGLGVGQSGLERVIKKAYETLGLISFLTCGEKEVKAWTVKKGSTAPQAAGTIHTDFEKKFIKAEVVSFPQFVEYKGWKGSRETGKARMEGREYIMQDGDVVEFKIGQ